MATAIAGWADGSESLGTPTIDPARWKVQVPAFLYSVGTAFSRIRMDVLVLRDYLVTAEFDPSDETYAAITLTRTHLAAAAASMLSASNEAAAYIDGLLTPGFDGDQTIANATIDDWSAWADKSRALVSPGFDQSNWIEKVPEFLGDFADGFPVIDSNLTEMIGYFARARFDPDGATMGHVVVAGEHIRAAGEHAEHAAVCAERYARRIAVSMPNFAAV